MRWCLIYWPGGADSRRFERSTLDYFGVVVLVAALVDDVVSAHFGGYCSDKYRELVSEMLN